MRAYTQAVKEGLKNSKTAVMRYGIVLDMHTDYNGVGKILYLLEKQGLKVQDSEYGEAVRLTVTVPFSKRVALEKEVIQATAGKCRIEEKGSDYFVEQESERI